jgi:uncharacterized protein (DUF952 family)
MSTIFHIATRSDWESAVATGDYRVSTLDRTLAEVGFIHCSTAAQVQRVADRYYRGVPELLLLIIKTDRITSPVQLDQVGAEMYPHIYGPLNLDAVAQVAPLAADSAGRVVIPELPGG